MAAIPVHAEEADALHLSLNECVATSLERNYGVLISGADIPIYEKKLGVEEAAFDLHITGEAHGKKTKSPVTVYNLNPSQTVDVTENGISAGVKQKLEQGANYEISVGMVQSKTDSQIAGVDPVYNPSVNLLVTQPLLRDYGSEVNRTNIVIARNNLDITKGAFTKKVMETVANTKDAYWRLATGRQELGIRETSLVRAMDFVAKVKEKIEAGLTSAIEIVAAQAAVAEREEAIIDARQKISDTEDQLKALLNRPDAQPGTPVAILTGDSMAFASVGMSLEEARKLAFEKRPELSQVNLDILTKQRVLDYNENQGKWRLDLIGKAMAYGVRGDTHDLSGIYKNIDPQMFDPFSGTPFNALTDTVEGRFYEFSLGLKLEFPLYNREAEHKVAKSRLELERAQTSMSNMAQQIDLEVRMALRAVQSAREKIEVTKRSRELAERKLTAENEKFEMGSATTFSVLQYQNDVANERMKEVNALSDYLRAAARLELATGTILENSGVTIR